MSGRVLDKLKSEDRLKGVCKCSQMLKYIIISFITNSSDLRLLVMIICVLSVCLLCCWLPSRTKKMKTLYSRRRKFKNARRQRLHDLVLCEATRYLHGTILKRNKISVKWSTGILEVKVALYIAKAYEWTAPVQVQPLA